MLHKKQFLLNGLILLLLAFVAILYLPVFQNSFTNWDDGLYILNNPYLKNLSLSNLKHFFKDYYAGNYHPLTLVSLSFDYKLGGVQPWPYQLTNILLHLINILLVYFLTKALVKLHSSNQEKLVFVPILTAAFFGIHTLQVESVAWMSERKNVLYTLFFLLSLITYIKYLNSKLLRTFILSLILFVLSLLSKGMAIPLTICIVLIDYLSGRNMLSKKVIWEKIPYLLLSLLFGYIAIKAQHSSDAIKIENGFLWFNRIAIACYGFVQYLLKLVYPYHLSAYYPYPVKPGSILPYGYYLCIPIVVMLAFLLWKFFRYNKIVLFGTFFFLANIGIVLQLLPVGDAVMADRYVYVASVGIFFIIGYYSNWLFYQSNKYRIITSVVLVTYFSILGVKTYNRIGIWKDSLTLWNNTLINSPVNNDRAYLNRGNVLYEMENYTSAFQDFNKLLHLDPKNSGAYIGMGRIKFAMKDFLGALNDINKALSFGKSYEGYLNRAVIEIELGKLDSALIDLDEACKLNRFRAGVYINRGLIYYKKGKYEEALQNYDLALQLEPQSYKVFLGSARVKQAINDMYGAMEDYNSALQVHPTCDGYIDRAVLKIALKDFGGAIIDLDNASTIDNFKPEIYLNRGIVELNLGNATMAMNEFSRAIELNKTGNLAFLYRAISEINLSDYKNALIDLDRSIQLKPTADAYFYRGITYMQLKRKQEGCEDLKKSAAMGNTQAIIEITQKCK